MTPAASTPTAWVPSATQGSSREAVVVNERADHPTSMVEVTSERRLQPEHGRWYLTEPPQQQGNSCGALPPPMGAGMAIFRILEATARPGAIGRLSELLVQQEQDVVAGTPGVLFVQSLRSGDSVLAVSSWRSAEDMQRYLQQPATNAFYGALPELLMGTPSVRTFEVISSTGGNGATGRDESGWRSA